MKRKEEIVVEKSLEEVEATIEEEVKKEELNIDGKEVKVSNNRLVDEEGFAISEKEVSSPEDVSELSIKIDGEREKYLKSAKTTRAISWAVMLPVLVCAIVAVFFVNDESIADKDWAKWLIIGAIVVCLGGSVAYSMISKRLLNNKAKNYVNFYYDLTTKYMLNVEGYTDVTINPKGHVDKEFFKNARAYKNVVNVRSRNLCTFTTNGRKYEFADLAAQVQGVKRLEPIFVGKVLRYKTEKEFNGRVLAQILSGNKLTQAVNDIEGLEIVSHTPHYAIYSDMHKEKNLMTKVVTDLFGKYKLGNDLLDVIISVNKGDIIVCLDYNDPVMQLPIEKKFDKKLIDDIQHSLFNSVSIIEAIAEKLEK